MTYQQAGRIAIIKQLLGWVIFIPALLSTVVSVINFIHYRALQSHAVSTMMLDFIYLMTDMVRLNTRFLNIFWHNSPVPDPERGLSSANFMFLVIYVLIFVGMVLHTTGTRIARQVERIREGIEDQLILERAKGNEGYLCEQLEEKIILPRHSIFSRVFTLYILPIACGTVLYFIIDLLGLS